MSDTLCWKCREEFKVDPWPWTHCHHEPKEKQKCWCDRFDKGSFGTYVHRIAGYLNFCPECGRKL